MLSFNMGLISFSILISMIFMANGAKSETPQSLSSKHFVLVHGACHGAWSWYKVVPRLTSSGHKVTALDLAASGIDPRQANDLQSISDYFQPLRDFVESLPAHEKVILVGHSYGGNAISQAMEYFPSKISVAVFLAAVMPGPHLNVSAINQEQTRTSEPGIDNRLEYGNGPNNPPTAITLGPLQLARRLYQLSPVEDWTLATTLMRKLRLFPAEGITRELRLSAQNYGSVNRVCIIAEYDKMLKKDFQLWMIRKNPPTEVENISSDHMAMMSQPEELCTRLLVIAKKYT